MGKQVRARHKITRGQTKVSLSLHLSCIERRLKRSIDKGACLSDIMDLSTRMNNIRRELYHLG